MLLWTEISTSNIFGRKYQLYKYYGAIKNIWLLGGTVCIYF